MGHMRGRVCDRGTGEYGSGDHAVADTTVIIGGSCTRPASIALRALVGAVCRAAAVPPRGGPTHPLGCHRRRIPDRVVFEHVVAALVHGTGYERIAAPGCSDRTMRRRGVQDMVVERFSSEFR